MTDKLQVCAVNTEARRGGAARIALILNNEFNHSALPIQSTLFHCGDRANDDNIVGLKRPLSRYLNAGLFRATGGAYSIDFGVAKSIAQKAKHYDLIHLHNLHGYYLNYRYLLNSLRDRPVVWTWHDMWGATGRCGFSFSCDGWKTGCTKCPNLNYYPATWVDRAKHEFNEKCELFLEHQNLTIVSPSQWLSDIAIDRGFDRQRVVTVPNPVDIGSFKLLDKCTSRDQLGLDRDRHYLLFVAADCSDPRKGFNDFCSVVQKLGVHGIAVGKPPTTVPGNITTVGSINDPAKMSAYYSACDAFVMTSIIDNYPNTTIEAQACGAPVFAYAAGGVPEQLPDFCGGLSPPGAIQDMAESIDASLERTSESANELASRLRTFAVEKWSPDTAARNYMNVYLNSLSRLREG